MQAAELVIFDFDGVLIDSEVVACGIAAEELTRLEYEVSVEDVIEHFAGQPDREMRAGIEAGWGRPVPTEYRERVNTRTEEAYSPKLEIMPGLIDALDANPIPLCVASSSFPAKLRLGLKVVGPYERVEPNVISASLFACGKPVRDAAILWFGFRYPEGHKSNGIDLNTQSQIPAGSASPKRQPTVGQNTSASLY